MRHPVAQTLMRVLIFRHFCAARHVKFFRKLGMVGQSNLTGKSVAASLGVGFPRRIPTVVGTNTSAPHVS